MDTDTPTDPRAPLVEAPTGQAAEAPAGQPVPSGSRKLRGFAFLIGGNLFFALAYIWSRTYNVEVDERLGGVVMHLADVVLYGFGIFATGNGIEHYAKAMRPRLLRSPGNT